MPRSNDPRGRRLVRRTTGEQAAAIRAVTFDVGGTLIECWPSVGHVYAEVAAMHGHGLISAELLNRNFKRAWQRFKDFRHTASQWSEIVDQTFHGSIDPLPSRSFFPELFERFSEPDAWRIFADVVPALKALRSQGLKLGIISNWDERLRPLLRKLALDSHFEIISVSCELGACKPNRVLFESTCAALGAEPAQTLHVGDSIEMDVRGAEAAGLRALWLRRGARRSSAGVIRSLRELDKI